MRIPTLLQKIHDLVDQNERPGMIEVDLMLDYTRVLYADLLEWRNRLQAQPPLTSMPVPPVQSPAPARIPPGNPAVAAPAPVAPPAAVAPQHPESAAATAPPTPKTPAPKPPTPPTPPPPPLPQTSLPFHEPTLAELAAAMHAEEEEEDEAPVVRPVPPRPPVPAGQQKERPLVTVPRTPVSPEPEAKPAPGVLPKAQDAPPPLPPPPATQPVQPPAPAQPQPKAQPPAPDLKHVAQPGKDIRSMISINDKYQIMSELFGNDKAAYEDALNHINGPVSEEAALKWLQERLWVTEERSDAAQNFYDLVKRFKS